MRPIKSLITYFKQKKHYLLCALIFFVSILLLHKVENHFVLTKISVINSNQQKIDLNGITALTGSNLFSLNISETQRVILKSNPVIKSIEIRKILPNELSVNITMRTPLMYLKLQKGYFLLDEDGVIIKKVDDVLTKNIPVATYYQIISRALYNTGDTLPNKDILDSLFFLSSLRSMRISINSIDIAGFDMLGLYTTNEKFYFSSEKDTELQEYQLSESVRTFRLSGKKFKTLDLRFEKPVVTF